MKKPSDYTVERAKRYRITNRITKQTYEASAFSADIACRKLGWMIGDCFVKELKEIPEMSQREDENLD